jgi:hypothetical protein
MTILALVPDFANRHLGWILFALILIAGVAVGFQDLARLSLRRIRAISSVSFRESIRRRVLWITPLAILGVIIVSQLQRPLDELDAVRQTTKFCLFATGLVVAITTIILACTNLPREIDNRVIYTVVTKPTTRLEIVLGKVFGFAKVSLTILIIMGVFSYGYLWLRATAMQRSIAQRLANNEVAAASVGTLTYYRDAGLLNAKTLETPDDLQIFARLPEETGSRRYFFGGGEGSFMVPYDINPDELQMAGDPEANVGLLVVAHVGYVRTNAPITPAPTTKAAATTGPTTTATTQASTQPTSRPYYGPFIMSPEERQAIMAGVRPKQQPTIAIDLLDANQNSFGSASPAPPAREIELGDPNTITDVRAAIDAKTVRQMKGRVYVRVTGGSADVEYFIDLAQTPVPIELAAPAVNPQGQVGIHRLEPAKDPADASKPAAPTFLTRSGSYGHQLRGGKENVPTAIYRFRNAEVNPDNGTVPFELRSGIERSGDEETTSTSVLVEPTRLAVRVRNLTSGQVSDEVIVQPESNRTIFFRLPADLITGGNFDVRLRCLTPGDFVGLQPRSLVLVTQLQPFLWNLGKSLLILWLMAILVTTVAVFTSTFLSWPIAVVLTLVILLGHWGVEQLGDATAPGIGAQVVTDFGLKNPAKAEAVRATVEKLSSFLNFISTILPDIGKFAAVEDIERGVAIPAVKLRDAAAVALGFGLPLSLLAYVFLKNKEVAP